MVSEQLAGGQITRLAFQANDQSRVNLYLDGQFALALDAVQVIDRQLRVGRVLTTAELAELRGMAEHGRARGSALELLSRRPRSRRELSERLTRKGYAAAVIEAVLDDLARRGYVDDEAFARYWVENRQSHQPRGRQALMAELRQKGVDGETIAAAVAPAGEGELAAALALARRRVPGLKEPDPRRLRQRLSAYLQRRGYSYEIVRTVVRQVAAEAAGQAAAESE